MRSKAILVDVSSKSLRFNDIKEKIIKLAVG